MCPGIVKSDMNPRGYLTPEQGADTFIYLAMLPENAKGPKGNKYQQHHTICILK